MDVVCRVRWMSSTPDPNLSQAEQLRYEIDKKKLFRTTIAIASAYGVIALVLLIIAMMDSNGATALSTDFFPFTVTLIGGMLFVLIALVVQITTFKPSIAKKTAIDDTKCPDYWVLQQTPVSTDADYAAAPSDVKALMTYQCVPDPLIFNAGTFGTQITGTIYGKKAETDSKNKSPTSKLVQVGKDVYNAGFSQSGSMTSTQTGLTAPSGKTLNDARNIRCDKLYPSYMAAKDSEFFPDNPNALRCKYAEVCGVPWTTVCPK